MARTLQMIINTPQLSRLIAFYTELLGAKETLRVPDEGPIFYLGLQIGDSELGLVADPAADLTSPQRILLSVEVDDVDELVPRVAQLGGRLLGLPNDMPWGQRVAHIQDPDGNAVNLTQTIPPAG
ncbi:MAG TPA: VOC family protein [Pseudonocardia sp.]|nr:VOC family protein [Pseudonocardia sp.]